MQHYFLAPEPESDREQITAPPMGSAAPHVPFTPVQRVSVAGDQPEQARRALAEAYAGTRFAVTLGDEPFSFRFASIGDERLTLRTATVAGHVSGEVPRLDEYVVTWLRSGSGRITGRDTEPEHLPNAPFLLPFERRYAFALTAHTQNSVHFSPAFLEGIAAEQRSQERLPLSFDTGTTPTPAGIAAWRGAVARVTDVLVDVDASPVRRLDAQRALALALLDLYPWVQIDLPAEMRESSRARTRLALEYLHHRAHEPITPADAARATGLHPRTFQLHLARHLDTSPTIYLRDIRLDRVRAELAQQSPDDTTVAAVARAWGFAHLGRFSAVYRARFGEHPRDTLRR